MVTKDDTIALSSKYYEPYRQRPLGTAASGAIAEHAAESLL